MKKMAHQPLKPDGKEKRRYARRATLQTARIRIGDGETLSAEIHDYCQTGLYVAFLGEGTPDAAIPALVGTPALVEFGGEHASGFRFKGRVSRVTPSGVGIFLLAMPEEALQALRMASSPDARPERHRAQHDLTQPQVLALKLECSNQFRNFLDAVLQDFFQHAVERLSEAGQEELSFLERSRFDSGAQELAMRRSQIEANFFNAIRDSIQEISPIPGAPRAVPEKNKLALVDEAEFEDWLNLSAIIKPVELDLAQVLDAFERRYSRLAGLPIDRKNNPFGPEMIGRMFQGAIQELGFSNVIRTILYKTLGQVIGSRGLEFYRQLNQTLAYLKPVERPDKARPRAASDKKPADAKETPGTDLAEIADTLNQLYKQDPAASARPAENAEYSLDRILAALNQTQQRLAAGKHAAPASRMGSSAGGQVGGRPAVLQVTDQLQQIARQLGKHAAVVAGAQAEAALPQASLQELLAAMDGFPLVSQAVPGGGKPQALTDQIGAHIALAGMDARSLAPDHRLILDTASNLFAHAREDLVPRSDVETLVKRLERPLLKLALQDPDFPTLPEHPARQVLNLIEQFAVAADDRGKFFDAKLQRFLFLLVDRVCSRADADPGIFGMVCDQLEKVLLPILQIRRTRIARMQEACEGRERIRSARSRVNAALEQRLAGREVPGILLRLLDAGWRQHLVLLEMRQGAQGEAWDVGLAVLDQLLDWLGPAHETLKRPAAASGALLATIERTLETVNVDASMLAAFMDELGERLTGQTDPATPGHAMVRVPPGRLAASAGERIDLHAAHPQLASRLRVGEWWDVSMEGRMVPMQLIWTSQPPLTSAFANRSATHKLELTLPELSRHIQDGLAKPGKDMDMPVIERSENALFDETYQDLMHQVLHDSTTGLLNRKAFMQRLSLLGMPEQADRAHVVGIIEFDQFRMIYNTCGVEAVEDLARKLANEAREKIGPDAVLASFRDDTLAILLQNCSRTGGCEAIDLLLGQMKDYHFQHEQHSYSIGFNLGVTEFSPAQLGAVDAIRRADSACITAKSLGRNRMQIYEEASPQLQSQESLMDWAGRIDSFLNGNGLHLRCQQVMPVGAGSPLLPYYEILLGIEDENGLEINPMHFIPAVERLQRAHEIDIWVIRNVFDWIRVNQEKFVSLGGLAINLSAMSLSSPEVMRFLQDVLPTSDFPTNKITFEITETAAIGSYGAAQDFIREIRRYGCKFALDDFGSGFTSYAHLKNLRTDSLKIDGSFVKDMLNNPGDYAMVKSMNDIGHSLGLRTVAEYVESPMILHALREIGVDYAQGYAVHKPCRIDEILRYESE
ncbi:MAG: DUF1631 family protein [Thiobacillus sp.]|nr:DUF1631 family protein [Thiobacillus sp.]